MSKRNKKKNIGKDLKKTFLDKIKENKRIASVAGGALVVLVAILLINTALNSNPLYGEYETGKLLYMTPLSSQSTESYEEEYLGITVSRKSFEVHQTEYDTTIEKPQYQTEEVTEEVLEQLSSGLIGENTGELFEGAEKVHYVYDSEGSQENYFLLEKTDAMYFVRFYIMSGDLHIWHVFELEK